MSFLLAKMATVLPAARSLQWDFAAAPSRSGVCCSVDSGLALWPAVANRMQWKGGRAGCKPRLSLTLLELPVQPPGKQAMIKYETIWSREKPHRWGHLKSAKPSQPRSWLQTHEWAQQSLENYPAGLSPNCHTAERWAKRTAVLSHSESRSKS